LIPVREMDGACKSRLRVGNEASLIAPADIGADRNLAPVLAPRDDAGAVHHRDARDLRKWNAPALVRRHRDLSDVRYALPRLLRIADRDVEAALAFEHRARDLASDRHFDHVLNVADVDAVTRHFLAVDGDLQLRLIAFLLDRRICG